MLSPEIPLLFMGEEALLATPFPFFCDFDGDLAETVRNGRRGEFPDFFAQHADAAESFPDPLDETTFRSAKIAPADFDAPQAQAELSAFRHLATARRRLVWPLTGSAYRGAESAREGDALRVTWRFATGTLTMALNPGTQPALIDAPHAPLAASVGDAALDANGRLALGPFAGAVWVTLS